MSLVSVERGQDTDQDVLLNHRDRSRAEGSSMRGDIDVFVTDDITDEAFFVARLGDTVVGTLVCSRWRLNHWCISHVYVEPDARDIGTADALMHAALESLRSSAERIYAQALPGDRAMKNLFERHGLTARTIVVGRDLSDPSTEARASQ
ncbi:MAG: GNAT family N-acetyltransferase [Ilumatobacteraceae bacterium]|nr:GNAT family N-acetyltransferase [Ilumatobacteraceae bacterium]